MILQKCLIIFLIVPKFLPDAQTQKGFNDSVKNNFTLSFVSYNADRNTIDTHFKYQVDIRSAQNSNSLKILIVAHQTADRIGVPNKAKRYCSFCLFEYSEISCPYRWFKTSTRWC